MATETRNVSIDEVFTWRGDLGSKAKEAFGGDWCDVSPQTFSDIKERCERIDRENSVYRNFDMSPEPMNGIYLHMVYGLPDGVLIPCDCANRRRQEQADGQ